MLEEHKSSELQERFLQVKISQMFRKRKVANPFDIFLFFSVKPSSNKIFSTTIFNKISQIFKIKIANGKKRKTHLTFEFLFSTTIFLAASSPVWPKLTTNKERKQTKACAALST